MTLAELSVRRPIGAAVLNLLIIVFGFVALTRLSVREAPDIDPPVVTVTTTYTGANAEIVETRVTKPIEDRLAGIEGIDTIRSQSRDGQSQITIEFTLDRDIDGAANDVRDRVSRAQRDLPEDIDPPQVEKADATADEIMWIALRSNSLGSPELTDLADRLILDRLTAIDGVARVRIGGERRIAMRVWLDREALAARGLTVSDIEQALRRENVELPAGQLLTATQTLTLRVSRAYEASDSFSRLPIGTSAEGATVRLGEVARIEVGAEQEEQYYRSTGQAGIGLGVSAQSRANVLDVARAVKAEVARIVEEVPGGLEFGVAYDASLFVEGALHEVMVTLGIAVLLVLGVVYLFLGSARATLLPMLAIPVSLIGGLLVIYAFGFTINILTLLAFVLAAGLVVDDAIVVLENIWRRIEDGEGPRVAAERGARQVFFAVVATTLVLVAVFAPIALQQGDVGRLFTEFAITMAGCVVISGIVALTLVPALSAKLLRRADHGGAGLVNRLMLWIESAYRGLLARLIGRPWIAVGVMLFSIGLAIAAFRAVPQELTPPEDRGSFFVALNPPEGAGFEYGVSYIQEVERILYPMVEAGEVSQVLTVVSLGPPVSARSIVALTPWGTRRDGQEILREVGQRLRNLPGVEAFARMRGSFASGSGRPLQFVLLGPTYEDLAVWRDRMLARARENEGLVQLRADYDEKRPLLSVDIDRERAAELGVSAQAIGATLQTMLGSRSVTTFLDRGEEYDVILQADRSDRRSPADLANIHVRSATTGEVIPLANLVTLTETSGASTLNRWNRSRSVTIEAGLAPGYTLGEALAFMRQIAAEELPDTAATDTRGDTRELVESQDAGSLTFVLAIVICFLVLAAQFESVRLPTAIMMTVPLAVLGGLLGLYAYGMSLNIYSQIGLVMLIGLSAKNGILMVEFANQLHEAGASVRAAAVDAAVARLRPVLMTAIATAAGAFPLIVTTGPGAETRAVIGVVVFVGTLLSTAVTLLVLPSIYAMLARRSRRVAQPAASPAAPGQAEPALPLAAE